MFDYYFAVIFFAVFIMVIMLMMIQNNDLLEKAIKTRLRILAAIVIVAALAEWLGVQLDHAPMWTKPLHIAVKTIELSVAPSISFVCTGMIGKIKKWKPITAFLLFHGLLELLSAFTGFIFYVDADNVYHHGTYYWIYMIAIIAGIVLFIFVVLSESRHQYGAHKAMMMLLPFFTVSGLAFQYLGEGVRVIWLCSSVDVLIIYILYVELTQNTDAVTHLMNRRYYDNRIAGLCEPATIFYFDVDDFKHINDTYGHHFGDVALATVGRMMHNIFGRDGLCYRIGGDEFAAITYIPESEAERYCEKMIHAMEIQQIREPEFPYISIGYAFYDPQTDNIADVIDKADAMMYERKRKSKELRKE